ncbi:hypothetical protein B9J90_06695, partial [Vibrio sp. V09_P4A23P171]|uniref:hypothetical protein n=1 Tax=Vibrio sp. V09_P4A23P171 TaxID=1938664 RepID=UPI000B9F8F43
MRKLQTKNSVVRTLIISLALTCVQTLEGAELEINDDMTGKLKVSASELNTHASIDFLTNYRMASIVLTWDNPYLKSTGYCDNRPNTVGRGDVIFRFPPDDPLRLRYMDEASEILESCVWYFSPAIPTSLPPDNIAINYYDKYNGWHSGIYFDGIGSTTPTPTVNCESVIVKHVSFGPVRVGEVSEGNGGLRVTCDLNASVEISVNEHKPLMNPDGSIIEFNYTKSHLVERGIPSEISINTRMVQAPPVAGSY